MKITQKKFEMYHWSWLGAHKERSAEWLAGMLVQGFDVHHLDGDHDNNDPENLVLIETIDHFRIHGNPDFPKKGLIRRKKNGELRKKSKRKAYELKAKKHNLEWEEIAVKLGIKKSTAYAYAKEWAEENKLKWPLSSLIKREKRKREKTENILMTGDPYENHPWL